MVTKFTEHYSLVLRHRHPCSRARDAQGPARISRRLRAGYALRKAIRRAAAGKGTDMLRIENLHKSFGGVNAMGGVSLDFAEGSLTAVIGPNGAGKTTFFNLITGAFRPDSGRVLLAGRGYRRPAGACDRPQGNRPSLPDRQHLSVASP